MKIKKLSIQSFGKLKNRSIEFTDGINVVYGNNESGKTTAMSFIRYMLFGFRGRRSETNLIAEEKYSPWDNTAISGSMDFEYDGCEYITSRSSGVRKEYCTLNNTLGSKSFEGQNPGEEIFGIDEAAFVRTYCLSAISAAFTSQKNDDIITRLSKKITQGLIEQKSEKIMELRRSLERISRLDERLKALGSQLYDTDSNIAGMRRTLSDTDRKNERFDQLNERYSSLRTNQILKLIIFVALLVLTVVLATSDVFGVAFAAIPAVAAVIDIFLMITARLRMLKIERTINNSEQDAPIYSENVKTEIDRTEDRKSEILKQMGAIEAQLEQEFAYDDICSNIDMLTEEKKELEKKLAIIEKAKHILDISYDEVKNVFVPALNKRASEIFSSLTGNKYNDIIITDTFEILVKNTDRYRSSKYFSAGMLELMYFSLRIALCEIIGGEEKLPVFLDDCFIALDDERARTALEFLVKYASSGRQIVFFTCHGRELRILSAYDKVNVIMI